MSTRDFKILITELHFLQIPSENALLYPVGFGTAVQSPNNYLHLVRDCIVS